LGKAWLLLMAHSLPVFRARRNKCNALDVHGSDSRL